MKRIEEIIDILEDTLKRIKAINNKADSEYIKEQDINSRLEKIEQDIEEIKKAIIG